MTSAGLAFHARVASLAIRQTGPRTWWVSSASEPGLWHTLKGAAGDPFEALRCSCQGGGGTNRCSHKIRLADRLGIEVPDAATRRRPATSKPSSLLAGGGTVADASVSATVPARESSKTGDSMADGLAVIEVYMPTRGNVRGEDNDGEITLRLCVPGRDAPAVDALLAALRAGGKGTTVQLVPVLTRETNTPAA